MYMDSWLKPAGVPTCAPSRKRALGMFQQQPSHIRLFLRRYKFDEPNTKTNVHIFQIERCNNVSVVPKCPKHSQAYMLL